MLCDTPKGQPLDFAERIAPLHTALIIVDMQNDFSHPDGVTGRDNSRIHEYPAMLERLRRLLDDARAAGVFVIHIRSEYEELHLSRATAEKWVSRGWTDSLCRLGQFGSEFSEGFGPDGSEREAVVTKHRFSVFWGSDIDLLLRSNGIRTVVMTGISTEICVESNARDAFFRDYHVVEVADCVECGSTERDQASKTVIERAFGPVVSAADVGAVWRSAPSGNRGWHTEVKKANLLQSLEERVSPKHTALVLIDVQNDFCDDKGAVGVRGEPITMIKQALPKIRRLLQSARQAGCLVVHVQAQYGAALS